MGRDASLDEFTGGASDDEDDADDAPDEALAEEEIPADDGSPPEEEPPADDGDPVDDGSGSTSGEPAADDGGTDESDADGPAVPATEAAPATVTFEWSPDGATCADCGASVERRWGDGDGLVCVDCKEW